MVEINASLIKIKAACVKRNSMKDVDHVYSPPVKNHLELERCKSLVGHHKKRKSIL